MTDDSLRRRIFMTLAAPVGAVLLSVVFSAIVLLIAGANPFAAYADMFEHAAKLETQVSMINRARS